MPGTHYVSPLLYNNIIQREIIFANGNQFFCYYFLLLDNLVSGLWKSAFAWLLTLLIIIVVFGKAQTLFHRLALQWGKGVTWKLCQSSCGFSQHQGMYKLKHNSETSFFQSGLQWASPQTGTGQKAVSIEIWVGSLYLEEAPAMEAFGNCLRVSPHTHNTHLSTWNFGLRKKEAYFKKYYISKNTVPLC